MLRRLFFLPAICVVVLALASSGVAAAQVDGVDDEQAQEEVRAYGDAELIDALRAYGLLDEWLAASPVSPQASVVLVTGNDGYQQQRMVFLNSLEAWANQTELVRNDLARLQAVEANTGTLQAIIAQAWDALVFDDRLSSDSETLVQLEDALRQLSEMTTFEQSAEPFDDPLSDAERSIIELRSRTETELLALNDRASAHLVTGIDAFLGYDDLQVDLNNVAQLTARAHELIAPARERSEQLVSSALAQIPNLHAARMLGSTDVGGISVVALDAYIRAGAQSPCSVDWALLAGIGRIESNHGRTGGASVAASGQVSTRILGPLLDGGVSEREGDAGGAVQAVRRAAWVAFDNSLWALLRGGADERGNGFAVVVDSDGGRLDGNDQWDRAIGPMQFLPETWRTWATDGNGDGVSDPHNLYDAAAAAGRFLCHLSTTRGPSPSSFVLGYNASRSYVSSVLSTAQDLRSRRLPDV